MKQSQGVPYYALCSSSTVNKSSLHERRLYRKFSAFKALQMSHRALNLHGNGIGRFSRMAARAITLTFHPAFRFPSDFKDPGGRDSQLLSITHYNVQNLNNQKPNICYPSPLSSLSALQLWEILQGKLLLSFAWETIYYTSILSVHQSQIEGWMGRTDRHRGRGSRSK
jgi:hypothetical protein